MSQIDIRLFDKEDPKVPPQTVKEYVRNVPDAGDASETFVVTHEPINLKEKLAMQKREPAPQPCARIEEDEEIIDENYGDDDDEDAVS